MAEPFIPPLPIEEWTSDVVEALQSMRPPEGSVYAKRKSERERGGKRVVNAFAVLANHPELARAFLSFNHHLLYTTTLDERLRELAILRIAWRRDCEYEWAQHVPVALALGLDESDLARVRSGPDAAGWEPLDALVVRTVDELHDRPVVTDQTWSELAAAFSTRQIMDLVFTIGAYDTLAVAFNCFGLELDPELAEHTFPDR